MTKPWTTTQFVASRVREIRLRQNLTVEQLAKRCREIGEPWLTRTVIGTLERTQFNDVARRRRISVDDLEALARALGVLPEALLPDRPPSDSEDLDLPGIRSLIATANAKLNPPQKGG